MKRLLIFCFITIFSTFVYAQELYLYAGVGFTDPINKLVAEFEKETKIKVTVEFGGMGQLLTRFNLTNRGDVFFSGAESYVDQLKQEGKISYVKPIVKHTPVLVVTKNKSDKIKSVEDLAKSNLKIGIGDPKAIPMGVLGMKLLEHTGKGDELKKKITVQVTAIKPLLIYLQNDNVDAGVIEYADAMKNKDKMVILYMTDDLSDKAMVGVLSTSKQTEAAKKLVDFLASPKSLEVFHKEGYMPLDK